MPARLTFYFSQEPARTQIASEGDDYVIGRDPACDIVLDDPRVSRRHARLTLTASGSEITDLGSKNGLLLEGQSIESASLPASCWLSVGGLLAHYESGPDVAERHLDEAARRRATLEGHKALSQPGLGLKALVSRLLASFVEMSGTDRGFVLLAGEPGRFDVVASQGLSAEAVSGPEFSGSASTVERVLKDGEPLLQSDATEDALAGAKPSIVREGIRALVCVPLRAAGQTLGAVYADSRRAGKRFSDLDVEILGALAAHAALAMWSAGLQQELEGLARGLPTRVNREDAVLPLPGFPYWPAGDRGAERRP